MTAEAEQTYAPAARQALAAFGVEPADLRFVHLSENVTFRAIDGRDGSPLVLRLHRPWYHDIAELRSEHLWTRALVQAGIAAPEPLLTQKGENFVQVEIAATPSPEACRSAIAAASLARYASHSASLLRRGATGRNVSGKGKARTDGFEEGS